MVMQAEKTVQLSGADLLIELLHEQQVELLFGYPGAVSYTHLTLPTNREV